MPTEPPIEPSEDAADQADLFRLAWGFYLALAIAGVLWIGWSHRAVPLALFVDVGSWWVDAVLGLSAGLLLVGIWDVARRFFPAMRELETLLAGHIGVLDQSQVLALALISGVAEELFFRGAVQTSWGFGWATVLFTIVHFGPGPVYRWWTLFAFVAALAFGGLVLYRGNILSAVLAHVVVNAINLRRLSSLAPAEAE